MRQAPAAIPAALSPRALDGRLAGTSPSMPVAVPFEGRAVRAGPADEGRVSAGAQAASSLTASCQLSSMTTVRQKRS